MIYVLALILAVILCGALICWLQVRTIRKQDALADNGRALDMTLPDDDDKPKQTPLERYIESQEMAYQWRCSQPKNERIEQ